MQSSNPALNVKIFDKERAFQSADRMTMEGTVMKSGFLLVIVVLGAAWIWYKTGSGQITGAAVQPWLYGSLAVGFLLAIVTIFKPSIACYTAPLYALAEGVLLGLLSYIMEMFFPGIVMQAVGLTFAIFLCMLAAYGFQVLRATERFKKGVVSATAAIFLVYLVSFILRFFGMQVPYIHSGGIIGIGFSLFVVGIAALNLILDFDFIEQGAQKGAPKYMEWFGAFSLLVTLVWLYIEILHLLAKMRD
ncbi:Bax inhibitor-1/YccA family protein [Planctomycetota bacterium]